MVHSEFIVMSTNHLFAPRPHSAGCVHFPSRAHMVRPRAPRCPSPIAPFTSSQTIRPEELVIELPWPAQDCDERHGAIKHLPGSTSGRLFRKCAMALGFRVTLLEVPAQQTARESRCATRTTLLFYKSLATALLGVGFTREKKKKKSGERSPRWTFPQCPGSSPSRLLGR